MRAHYTLILVLALILIAVGCGGLDDEDAVRGDEGDDWNGVDDDYDLDDELPGFGDDEVIAMGEDDLYDDPFSDDENFKNDVVDNPDARAFNLRLVWGNLIIDPDFPEPVDYSGQISISSGGLEVLRTVRFEPAEDYVHERTDPQVVSFNSRIWCCADGLLLKVYALPDDESVYDEAVLTLNIGPYERTIPVGDLVDMIDVSPSGAYNDAVAVAAFEDLGLNAGFIDGHWRNLPNKRGGVFKAKWETPEGTLNGHERGRYIPTDEGAGLFRGKIIDPDGGFRGLLDGEYQDSPGNGGIFEGDWLDAELEVVGMQYGRYYHDPETAGLGFFLGMWELY